MTVEAMDELSLNLTKGLSERLSRARSNAKAKKDGCRAARPTHAVKLSEESECIDECDLGEDDLGCSTEEHREQ